MKEQKTKDSQSHYEQKIRIKLNGNHNSTLNLKLHYKEVIIKSVYSTEMDASTNGMECNQDATWWYNSSNLIIYKYNKIQTGEMSAS